MTVSDAVGPWEAGYEVVNTVTNPLIIKPESSAITGVVGNVLSFVDDTDLGNFVTGDNVYVKGGVASAPTFAPVTYSGNGGTQSINCGFSPDLVWIKSRTEDKSHELYDTIRGPLLPLNSNSTDQEFNTANSLTAFNADGFSIGSRADVNAAGQDFVAWCFDAGDTTVTNNEGTIESQVRSNGNFSVVSYTGTGSSATIGHGLNAAPAMVIVKRRDDLQNWRVGHDGLTDWSYRINLESPDASVQQPAVWNSTAPTSSVFSIGTSSSVNGTSGTYIAYCWAATPTQSFGSYTGNGSTTGPVINCGFEPAFVMIKCTDIVEDWAIYDSARSTFNPRNKNLFPNSPEKEAANVTYNIDFTATGFQLLNSNNRYNGGGKNYIYAAFSGEGAGTSGVVGFTDSSALTMTLSASSGTWEVGQQVTMDEKEQVIAKLYCELDTIGNVTGLTSIDPGYRNQASISAAQSITFPTQLPTGNTPDVELPAGTSISVTAKATNELGTSSATSNTLFPS
jgi:hypothetical protein